ncbi:AAA family ATPase [Clostridium sp. CM027]|uniref:AAA family ATPase n=1 Tax=Clostridium sp. CM027 TaxID=2849865 RepID=UPI001C6F43D9|nr:AAA family ATPase [Clostridium sp. CM027]MBW9144230.1 AAA family ATPase [Clostridium sp. CM027]UVE41132.1 AAA family ATPase [Clostridium sp. CM027]
MNRELTPKDIIYEFDIEDMSTKEELYTMPQYYDVIENIKTAMSIDKEGFNIYLIDDFSKETIKEIMKYVNKSFENKSKPKDICYVLYEDEKSPKPIFVSNGGANKLKETFEEMQNEYLGCTFQFYNNSANKEIEDIQENIQKKRNKLIGKLIDTAKEKGFDIKSTNSGFTFIPLSDEKEMSENEYETLDKGEKDNILYTATMLKENARETLEELKDSEGEDLEKIKQLMEVYYKNEMNDLKEEYKNLFMEDESVQNYFDIVCNDIEKRLIDNYSLSYDDDEEKINEIIYKYAINVMVDNSENQIRPVIFEQDPNLTNLLGNIEYENHKGVYSTGIEFIKSGSILKANEGCLIIRANDLLKDAAAYHNLKKTLLTEEVDSAYNRNSYEIGSLNAFNPEPIPVKEKIILIGNYETYDLLYNYDEDFRKIFTIKAECNPVQNIDNDLKKSLVFEINKTCCENNYKFLTKGAIREVAKILSRKAQSREKIYYDKYEINKLLILANNKVIGENKKEISEGDIIEVGYKKDIMEKEILDNYTEKKMLIDVINSRIGQVNGLSVMDTGYFSFGKPIKITCCCYKGEGNIIDVQKESNLSGSIHSKSINILKGYISTINGGFTKLPVDFHLSFEQIYGKIDGDSASVAEIMCMLSALSKIPIKQSIAITGSVNQFGEVQPIGGVNDKIEGFFAACKAIDSIKDKGVMIPLSNAVDLVLNEEVESEIKNGNFHIYTMTSIEDAIGVLMGNPDISFDAVMIAINKELKKYSKK